MNKEEQIIIGLMKKNKRLEKENEELIKEIEKQKNEKAFWHIKNDLKKEKIDKAIEYVEWYYKDNQEFYKNKGIGLSHSECDGLLDILKGVDKE